MFRAKATPLAGVLLLALFLLPLPASARINLGNTGGIGLGGVFRPTDPTEPPVPPGGGGGGGLGTVAELEAHGYVCTTGNLAAIECRQCSVEPVSETQTCEVRLCLSSGTCNETKRRYDIPAAVDTDGFGYWAREFAWDASSFFIADFNGDGRRDLGARVGAQTKVALSRGTYFQDVGVWTGPVPLEMQGVADVNGDGFLDVLSVSPDGHLVAGISNGSGIVSTVEMPEVFCAGIGDCLIGDVNGDGFPDLIDVMRGSIGLDRSGDVWVSLGTAISGFPALPDAPPASDADADGLADRDDVCIEASDPSQLDSDGDGYGNACDADLDGDLVVTADDRLAWIECFFAGLEVRPDCASADFDGDGLVAMNDYWNVLMATMGNPPGPSAIDAAPQIELFAPADGTILNVLSTQAWVAGWVSNVPAGDVDVTVNGVPVPLTGPDNFFTTFVALARPPTEASLFRPILVEAVRGDATDVVRRVVMQGETVKPGFRAHGALGARLSAEGLGRVEEYLQNVVAQKLFDEAPATMNGYTHAFGCVDFLPICYSGYEISNASMSLPQITVEFLADSIRVQAWIESLRFDWEVDIEGPNCGEDATVHGVALDMRYRAEIVAGGRVELRELHEPVIDADIQIDGCWGGGHGKVRDGIVDRLRGQLDDPDDIEGSTLRGPRTGAVGSAVETIFRSLAVNGSLDIEYGGAPSIETDTHRAVRGPLGGLGGSEFTLEYASRYESVVQNTSGLTVWLGAGVDVAEPVPGLGSPDGAYQIPFASTPQLPLTLGGGGAYHVSAAVTPNGLNEVLDAVARSGFVQAQGIVLTETEINGFTLPLTAAVLRQLIPEFKQYPVAEAFRVVVWPSTLAPVVSGRRGPGGEPLDVQLAQTSIEFIDASGDVALGLRVDARVGVDIALQTAGTGKLVATARRLELLDFALVENALAADPAVVFEKLLCVGADPTQAFACAISGHIANGLDEVLASVELPSLPRDTDTEEGFALVPKCLERLGDGTLVAQFGLLLPGETVVGGIAGGAISVFQCTPPLNLEVGGGGPVVGPVIGPVYDARFGGTLTPDPGFAPRQPVSGTGAIDATLATRR